MNRFFFWLIGVLAFVFLPAKAHTQSLPQDTAKAVKVSKKALKLMESDNEVKWQEGFDMYKEAAKMGLKSAQRNLVAYYLSQNPRNEIDAIYWSKLLAEAGDVRSQYLLGWIYLGMDTTSTTAPNEILGCKYMRMAAEQGDADAQCLYGRCCLNGIGTLTDYDEAEKYLLLSAEKDNVVAQYYLGGLYYFEEYGRVDPKKAFRYYKKAAECGNGFPDAMYNLAIMYHLAEGVEKSLDDAIYWYTKASSLGLIDAKNNLTLALEEKNGSKDDAIYLLRKAADSGDEVAQYNLANRYMQGDGVTKNLNMAIDLYKKSADKGYAHSQYLLGRAYLIGEGVEQNGKLAFLWIQKAAEQGDTIAIYNLGFCYEHGVGVDQNSEKAFSNYKQAADLGLPLSLSALSKCYLKGYGTQKSEKLALECAQNGMAKDDPESCYILGLYYEYGTNTKIDYAKAIECYEKALSLDIEVPERVYFYKALCYDKLKKYAKAVEFYKKAAALGYIAAQYNLAMHYLNGEGISRNQLQAKNLLKKCALQKDNQEIKRLANEQLSKMN